MSTKQDPVTAFEQAASDQREQVYVLRLYVGGASPKSIEAIDNLKRICDEYLTGRHEIEVVDIYQQPRRAIDEHVSAVPMLVKRLPIPVRRLIGNLSNTGFVLQRLALRGR